MKIQLLEDLKFSQDPTPNEALLASKLTRLSLGTEAYLRELADKVSHVEQLSMELPSFTSRVENAHDQIAQLKDRLFGDEEINLQRELTTIEIRIASLADSLAIVTQSTLGFDDTIKRLETLLVGSDTSFSFLKKLEAFFGPMLEGKNPPLDGNQVATKDYVDKSVERIASRLREQMARAIEVVNAISTHVGEAMGSTQGFAVGAIEIAKAFATLVSRERERIAAEERAKNQPSRIESLLHALTGRNGAR